MSAALVAVFRSPTHQTTSVTYSASPSRSWLLPSLPPPFQSSRVKSQLLFVWNPNHQMSNVGQHLLSVDLLKTRLQQGDGALTSRKTGIMLRTAQDIAVRDGLVGLWRGTSATLVRNVPGVALYMTSLTQLRTLMATSPYFAAVRQAQNPERIGNSSVLPKLSSQGNLLAGATARVGVGFLLNPFSVLKARYESQMYAYESLSGSFLSIVRLGPSELLRGFLASSLRDAPYAGLFVVFYEGIKRESWIHSLSAASAGAIATIITHPFDVVKVGTIKRPPLTR
ncbi:hypothetical protein SERLA73DRAFT_150684 [Serpula lacrymans var. lacrymans S7.3]|uniref:Solute carrier family 25 member 38 homolog n=1 Tax=Serpula lacrymans var. lacrymans (strain S7.3) TaxID=936435 RepID=F8PQ17_SERL3|nr:hypothetical protein SERLA73DRAFT_150684 [Serpula lacrymans var. lacrymans S7.3]